MNRYDEPPPGDATTEFWEARHSLRHIRDFARGRRVCPWSVFGVVAVRASCHIPPHVHIPPLVGGRVSLNLFCALVGPSGVGKGGSESAGRDAIKFAGTTITDLPELPLGSGEGVARTFQGDDGAHTALFTAQEIDSLGALFARQGATLESELRKMWTGETLGFTNSDKKTRTHVPQLSYRAGVIVGVQPRRAAVLLQGADGGTPQRFMWMPVLDPHRPDQRPDTPDPITVEVPRWNPGVLVVPDVAIRAVDDHQAAIHRQDPDVDPLAGHALLCRLKVACALMLLDQQAEQRAELNEEDWHLAGCVMAVSDATRADVQRAARDKARSVNQARALATAERQEIVSERKLQRAKEAILRRLTGDRQLTKNQLRQTLKADIRDDLQTALGELLDSGKITVSPARRGTQRVHVYHQYTSQKLSSTSDDEACTAGTRVPTPLRLAHEPQTRRRQRTRGKYRSTQQTDEESA
ncbi:MAG: hypothetical protein ACRDTS_07610 [Mycobacterium sp.]